MNQYPNQPSAMPPMPPGPKPGNGMATAALVMGIISLVIFAVNILVPFLEVATGIVGIVLAIMAGNQGYVGGKRTAGLVCSIISVALGGLYWVACFLCAVPFMFI